MIREYYEDGDESGIVLSCEKECAVLEDEIGKLFLQLKKIVFCL